MGRTKRTVYSPKNVDHACVKLYHAAIPASKGWTRVDGHAYCIDCHQVYSLIMEKIWDT